MKPVQHCSFFSNQGTKCVKFHKNQLSCLNLKISKKNRQIATITYCFCIHYYNSIQIIEKFKSRKFTIIGNVVQFNIFSCNQLSILMKSFFYKIVTQFSELLLSFSNTYFQLIKLLNYNQLSTSVVIEILKHSLGLQGPML